VDQKGLHHLLEMASVLKQQGEKFIVRIAGFGPLEHELKTKTKALGLENIVEFPGFVKDVPGFVNGLDVYVCSSEFEGFGFAIAEAMHAAKPVTGFRVSSNPELVINGETGFLVPPFDVKALAEKNRDLMHDANMRKRMGMAGKNRAMQMFHKEKQHQQFCALMQELSRKADD
jgi:glycosyltransferase involved in cell wall biosynthesis